jgi:hypothetical protein
MTRCKLKTYLVKYRGETTTGKRSDAWINLRACNVRQLKKKAKAKGMRLLKYGVNK